MLETLDGWLDEIPPVSQSLRYGNPAFRTWHARAVSKAQDLVATVLPPQLAPASIELGLYLSDSLGEFLIDGGSCQEAGRKLAPASIELGYTCRALLVSFSLILEAGRKGLEFQLGIY